MQSKGFSRVFSNTIVQSINSLVLSFLYSPVLTSIHDHWKTIALTRQTFVGKVMSLLFNTLSRLVITFLSRSKHLLIPWLQSPSAVILKPKKIKSTTVSTFSSVQFSSVTQLCPTLCDPMNRSKPGLPVHHQLREFTETHVHRVSDTIQPSHPLSSPSPPAPNPSQHQSFPMSQVFA